ncbi:MAG: hypothetical protein GY748_18810, partial [Planctomycetaceae bacterium]|nr:hypothetical protein [Planctomycetaceae bacterium]
HLQSISKHDDGDVTININRFSDGISQLDAGNSINYDGASGKIEFNADGDPGQAWYQIWKIENGVVTEVEFKQIQQN